MIPNILHYVHLSEGGREWQLHNFLSVKSAALRGWFTQIVMWVDKEIEGEWWDKTKDMVDVYYIEPPEEIYGIPITQLAHKSDVLRLQILIEHGGVYVDTDTIFVKSYEPLLDNKFVLGQQGMNGAEGLCPAVILSEPGARFGQYWLAGFEHSFKGGPPGSPGWCIHSVEYPYYLSKQLSNEITILNHETFFWPLYHSDHMKMLFEEVHHFPNAYSHHLWESSGKEYLNQLTEDSILEQDTTFNLLVRNLL